MSKDRVLFLDNPIHKNSFPKDIMGDEEVLDSIVTTFDGTIVGVDFDIVESFFNSEESKMIRLGMRKPPKDFRVKDKESFYRYLSFQELSF